MDALQVVESYLEAFAQRDFEAVRTYLADRGFEYLSPIASYDDADVFLSNMDAIGAILQRMEIRQRFTADNDVCHVLDVTVGMDGYETQSVVSLARVEGNRIVRVEVIFDATRLNHMIGHMADARSD
jgi:hypothetical protein